jgi:hypothetical protein
MSAIDFLSGEVSGQKMLNARRELPPILCNFAIDF